MSSTAGRTSSGTPKAAASSGSPRHASAVDCVREAVEGPVAKPAPRRSHRKASTVPRRSVPASRARATATSCSSSQASLPARSRDRAAGRCGGSPPRGRQAGPPPPARACPATPRSASAPGRRSPRPSPAPTRPGGRGRRRRSHRAAQRAPRRQRRRPRRGPPLGSCSTQPGRGCVVATRRRASRRGCSRSSKSATFTAVVPSSMQDQGCCHAAARWRAVRCTGSAGAAGRRGQAAGRGRARRPAARPAPRARRCPARPTGRSTGWPRRGSTRGSQGRGPIT